MTIVSNILGDTFQAISSPFVEIWNFILYNIASPLLVIVFVVLFFVGQYFLIKLYIKFIQYVGTNIVKAIGWIIRNEKIKKIASGISETLAGK